MKDSGLSPTSTNTSCILLIEGTHGPSAGEEDWTAGTVLCGLVAVTAHEHSD